MGLIMRILTFLIIISSIVAVTKCQANPTRIPDTISESTILSADSISIAYETRGSGNTTLVFVHGWCSDRTFWREQLDDLAGDYLVVAIDLPGHGNSGRTRKKWSLSSFARDVKELVESLSLEQVVLIGHSMGGLISLEAAQHLPERVIGIIGVDTIGDVERADQPEMMDRVIAAFENDFVGTMNAFMPNLFSPTADSELIKWATERSTEADPVMALAIMRRVTSIDEKRLLSSVNVPVRVIYAALGDSIESQSIVETNKKYADFDAVFVQGVGHFLQLEKPNDINRHLRIFLNELEQ